MSSGKGVCRAQQKSFKDDFCVLSRWLNCPELIFNQNSEQDENLKARFFEQGHAARWRAATTNTEKRDYCYVCQKHKYALIFYERAKARQKACNPQLREIKDLDFLEQVKEEYDKLYSVDPKIGAKVTTPLIFGTPVR